jgi:hypothetical protein
MGFRKIQKGYFLNPVCIVFQDKSGISKRINLFSTSFIAFTLVVCIPWSSYYFFIFLLFFNHRTQVEGFNLSLELAFFQ